MQLNNELNQRLKSFRQRLADMELEAALISDPINRRWLSGFNGSAAYLLVSAERALLGTDFRYWEQAREQAPAFELYKFTGPQVKIWPEFVAAAAAGRIGLESAHLTIDIFNELQQLDGVEWVLMEESCQQLRAVKSAAELAAVRAAAAITDAAMARVPQLARPGMTEKELAWELEKQMREAGADELAFPSIIASGPNGAFPHHDPGERRLQKGDAITVDMGARLNGYHSDLTRSFYLGPEPDERFNEIFNLVAQAQAAALDGIKAGISGREVDALARNVIEEAGYGKAFGHGLGHGVGLDIHEDPRLGQSVDQPLPAGSIITIEPGIYLPGWSGIRIEDLVLVTEDGLEMISHCPKEPLIAGNGA